MSRLFLKLFVRVWLTLTALLTALFVLINLLNVQPPERESQLRVETILLELARDLVSQGGQEAIVPLAKAARAANPPIEIKATDASQDECDGARPVYVSPQFVAHQSSCTRLSIASLPAPAAFPHVIFPFIFAAVGSLIAAFLLAHYLSGPILTLRDGLHALAGGDFGIRIGKKFGARGDEISNLGLDFDVTAIKLEALQHIQQGLYHDISHELRSPLSRLRAAFGILRQNPGKLEVVMPRMEREIERLDALVDAILALAKLTSGYASSFEKTEIDVIDLLAPIVDDSAFEARSKNVSVDMDTVESFVCKINGELIYRAIENVVRNAVKYTRAGTRVTVEARIVETASRKTLRIHVSDRGPGVPPEDLQRIFEPFRRAAGNSEVTGHGLGLAIARRALEIHGGSVSAENRPGGGLVVMIAIDAS